MKLHPAEGPKLRSTKVSRFERSHDDLDAHGLLRSSEGVIIDTDTCNEEQQQAIKVTLENIKAYIVATRDSLQSSDHTLFNYFFRTDDHATVDRALHAAYDRLNKVGATNKIYCPAPHITKSCAAERVSFIEIGWDTRNPNTAIMLCDEWFSLPDLPTECDESSLGLEASSPHKLRHRPYYGRF